MTRVVLDPGTRAKLAEVYGYAELRDEAGRLLGHFIPAADPQWYRQIEIAFSEEELAAAEREEGFSTPEVLRRLQELKGRAA
jgi:hypothetical protein